uniref:Integrin beta-like protein 1 n=1 Tax=Denticeps clupeoides TaxID=299321 RepID=A0AAY4DAI3_9TELE
MTSCPADDVDEDVLLTVQPVGFNESVAVRVKQTCGCDCGLAGRCHDNGESGSCGAADEEARLAGHRQCQAEGSGTVCSGRGSCVCGMCVCHHGNLGAVYGKFCELDDFSCPYQDGLLCGGRGQCVLGECRCQTGWTGESCGCPISAETCRSNDGILCSGHGRCVCGSCVCDEPQHDVDEDVLLTVQPVGFNESVAVRVKQTCGCDCGLAGRCHDNGESGSCGAADEEARLAGHRQCQAEGSGTVCSGRGSCVCGMCVCHHGNLGAVYGKFCELDDFSCPYQDGLLCGGRGQCVLGECRCQTGWTGESCGCPISAETCRSNDGILCSGHGRCVCGSCVCDEPQRSGRLCDKCPTCYSSCQTHWWAGQMNPVCTPAPIAATTGSKWAGAKARASRSY